MTVRRTKLRGLLAPFARCGSALAAGLLSACLVGGVHAAPPRDAEGVLGGLNRRSDDDVVVQIAAAKGSEGPETFERLASLAASGAVARNPTARRHLAEAFAPYLSEPYRPRALTYLLELARFSGEPSEPPSTAGRGAELEFHASQRARATAMRVLCLSADRRAALALWGWARTGEQADGEARELAQSTLAHCPTAPRLIAHLSALLPEHEPEFLGFITVPQPLSVTDVVRSKATLEPLAWQRAVNRVGSQLECRAQAERAAGDRCGPVHPSWLTPSAWKSAHESAPEATRLVAGALQSVLEKGVRRRVKPWLGTSKDDGVPRESSNSDEAGPRLDRVSKLIMETVWPNWPTSQLWGIHEDLASDWKHLTVAPLCQRIHLGSAPSPVLDRWLTRGSLAERAACIRGLGAHESTQALGVILAHYEQESHSAARQVATSAAVRWLERLENHHEKVAASSVQELRAFLESMARFDPDFGVRSIASGRPESVPTSRFLRYDAKDEWTFDQSGRPLRRRSLSPRWSTYRGQ